MSIRRFAVFMGIAAIVASSPASAQESGIAVGTQAPGAKVQTLDGKSINIGSYVGKSPMLIEFWAFWCPNCRELEPSLVALQKKYAGRVRFLAVAVSVNETLDRVKTYAARKGYKHETVYDGFGEATEAYDVPATSYVVVLDKTGKVVYTGLGGKQNLEPAILKALR
jgi:thiol-disulfide isomerase/thioredoxin